VTEYHALIAQAVGSLDQNTGKARRALYERARTTQVTQLRAIHPPLSESVIAKERLALENAIRKVETDNARESGTKAREPRLGIAPPRPDAGRLDSERPDQASPKPGSIWKSRRAATGTPAGRAIAQMVDRKTRQRLRRCCQRGAPSRHTGQGGAGRE
jgi:hypothetical protein